MQTGEHQGAGIKMALNFLTTAMKFRRYLGTGFKTLTEM
jgi:hypothetical protein